MFSKRVDCMRKIMEEENLDGAVITSRDNTLYLSSFGSAVY